MTPRVLWVTPVAEVGGVARHVLDVARVGIPGHELVVLTPPGPLAAELAALGAAHVTAEFGPSVGMARSVQVLRSLWRHTRPALVHTHLAFADLAAVAGLPRGLRGGTRLVTSEHGINTGTHRYQRDGARARLTRAAHTARLTQTDAVIAVSHATARAMEQQWRARGVVVVHNGIDRPPGRPFVRWPSAPDRSQQDVPHLDGPQVVALARLAPEKGLDALLRAFALVVAQHPGAHLTIGGEGPERAALEQLTQRLGLTGHVDLPGVVRPGTLEAIGDVLALTSASENCSYALLDAVVAGLGVCASPVGGNPEIVGPQCLADPDDPDAVAAVLIEQATNLGARPTLPPDWPTVAEMTARIAEVYHSCS